LITHLAAHHESLPVSDRHIYFDQMQSRNAGEIEAVMGSEYLLKCQQRILTIDESLQGSLVMQRQQFHFDWFDDDVVDVLDRQDLSTIQELTRTNASKLMSGIIIMKNPHTK